MANPRFTVIVPAYNRQTLLDEAVASVLGQTLSDFELIVVDDHSPIPLKVPDDPRITLLRNEANIGKSAGVNRALQKAAGEIVAFLDDDDAWGPYRLENAERAHHLCPVAVCRQVSMGAAPVDASGGAGLHRRTERENARLEMPGSMNTVSVERSICPPFDPEFRGCEDIEWGIRLQERTSEIAVIESTDSFWRQHVGPRHRNARRERLDASIRLLELHATHYDTHPQQKAFRLFRIGYMLLQEQARRESLRYGVRSLAVWPNRLALVLVVRTLVAALEDLGKSFVHHTSM